MSTIDRLASNPYQPTLGVTLKKPAVETTPTSATSSHATAATDTASISAQGQALADAAVSGTAFVGQFEAVDTSALNTLTDDDKRIIGFPSNDPSVSMLAWAIAQARQSGTLKGPLTEEALTGGTDKYPVGIFDALPQNEQFTSLRKTIVTRLASIRDSAAEDLTKLLKKARLLQPTSASTSDASSSTAATKRDDEASWRNVSQAKHQQMLRDYGA